MIIVLYQPQIPQNTGNIIRTCAITNTKLVLVRPLGFSLSQKALKRAGLDYWRLTNIELIDDLPAYLDRENKPFSFFSSKAKKQYSDASYSPNHILIFGSETSGLDPSFFANYEDHFVTIPMQPAEEARCLNLSNSVCIGLYEALRQNAFSFQI